MRSAWLGSGFKWCCFSIDGDMQYGVHDERCLRRWVVLCSRRPYFDLVILCPLSLVCSRWFSEESRSVIDRILVPDPKQRLTLAQMKVCVHWYRALYTTVIYTQAANWQGGHDSNCQMAALHLESSPDCDVAVVAEHVCMTRFDSVLATLRF